MKDYLNRHFEKEEVDIILDLIKLYNILFSSFAPSGRIAILIERADTHPTALSEKIKKKASSSKKYKEELDKAYIAYGHTTIL